MNKCIIDLYVNENLNISEISERLSLDKDKVVEILSDNYIIQGGRTQAKTIQMYNATLAYINDGKLSATKIAKEFGITPTAFCKYLKSVGVQAENNQNKTKFNEHIFDSIDTEEKAYWLGFIFADGGISRTPNLGEKPRYQFELSLSDVDSDHLIKFNKFMGHILNNVKYGKVNLNGKMFGRCRWIVNNKYLWNVLNDLGCVPQKSLLLKFPNIPQDLIRHFIRGYFDGDGSLGVYETRYNPRVMCSCIGTLDMLGAILKSVGIEVNYYHDKRHSEYTYSFQLVSSKCIKFLNYIYKDSNVFLERKYKKYLDICRLYEESYRELQTKIGEGCDANPEVITETKESVTP